ncbi:MAG TPA: PD-(D/E)XK nuclease family protein [Thermoanaerobacterales bacterium]|nr:PD-(D/E)XK nuclease family protein [Thermoanaerobacterales bacterium]
MYAAELHGKLPLKSTNNNEDTKKDTKDLDRMEDILTSNVFSFFKYANRKIFLKEYLKTLGFKVTNQEAIDAEFRFWPRYDDNTEPDLVILIGNYYLLVEAKYFSNFGKETTKNEAQLIREIKEGESEAKAYNKYFKLIAITADHIYKKYKFESVPPDFQNYIKWTNWQQVSSFLEDILNSSLNLPRNEREFALDLYTLLDKKGLRGFKGFNILNIFDPFQKCLNRIFFEAATAKFRGAFIGFLKSLYLPGTLYYCPKNIFFSRRHINFSSLLQSGKLDPFKNNIFFEGKGSGNYDK